MSQRVDTPVPTSPFAPGGTRVRLLVSVRDAAEARLAAQAGADLVDAKDPERGALGALDAGTVRAIVLATGAQAGTSAVAGEPAEADLAAGIGAMAATGVGYVKVAVCSDFSDAALAHAAATAPGRLIAVLFAERGLAPDLVHRLAAAGLVGAMIDTAGKDGRRLTDHLGPSALEAFTQACRRHGLLSGLAGSLALADIPGLCALGADYLGFRGGLCHDGDRRQDLDPARLAEAVTRMRAQARRTAA